MPNGAHPQPTCVAQRDTLKNVAYRLALTLLFDQALIESPPAEERPRRHSARITRATNAGHVQAFKQREQAKSHRFAAPDHD